MLKIIYFLSGLLILSGCGTLGTAHSAYEQKLSPWVGRSSQALYSAWGYPRQLITVDANTKLAVYFSSESQPINNNFEPYAGEISYAAMANSNFGVPPQPPLYYCKTTFVIRNGIVSGYNFNGDDCY